MRALIGSRGAWVGLALLAGCATEPPPPPAPLRQPPPGPVTAPHAAASPPTAIAPSTRSGPGEPAPPLAKPPPSPTETMLAPPSASPPGQTAAIGTPPASLIGLTMQDLEARFGRPNEQFDRAPAKVWQYRSGECVLDVYFYLDVARNAFHSLHHDAKRDGVQDEGCVRRIQDARRQS